MNAKKLDNIVPIVYPDSLPTIFWDEKIVAIMAKRAVISDWKMDKKK